ncbi:hypothetical protein [Kitasatospora sp. NPDC088134]|uniref:hypothetical protein n=1 Tax=Kitasatospora sp. NPDC088134 TaxID=3364071 RepID=UPI0038289DF3
MTAAPKGLADVDEVADRVRGVLRESAREVSCGCDPADPDSARDVLTRHLRQHRRLEADPGVEFRATIVMGLAPGDRTAVDRLLDAQRRQAVVEALRQQRTDALAKELCDPAGVLARWAEQESVDWTRPPTPDTAAAVARAFAGYRPESERSVDLAVLEVLRDFLASFPEQAQRKMLCTLLASGMRRADRTVHAERVESLVAVPAPVGG